MIEAPLSMCKLSLKDSATYYFNYYYRDFSNLKQGFPYPFCLMPKRGDVIIILLLKFTYKTIHCNILFFEMIIEIYG